jgi:DNA segregation ATPase FtsK/SpoIIIE, S-DNA-T family
MAAPLFAPPSAVSASGVAASETPTAPGVRARNAEKAATGRTKAPVSAATRQARARYIREISALLLFVSAVITTLALASYAGRPGDETLVGADWVGPVGAWWASVLVGSVGVLSWAVPLELVLLTWPLLKDRASIATVARLAGNVLSLFVLAALVHVAFPKALAFGAMPVGGSIGELFGEVLRSLFSTVGSFLVGLTAVALIFIGRQSFSFIAMAQRATHGTEVAASKAASGAKAVAEAWERAAEIKKRRDDEERSRSRPVIHDPSPTALAIVAALETDDPSPQDLPELNLRLAPGADDEPMLDFAPLPRSKRLVPQPDLSPEPAPVVVEPPPVAVAEPEVPRGRSRKRRKDAVQAVEKETESAAAPPPAPALRLHDHTQPPADAEPSAPPSDEPSPSALPPVQLSENGRDSGDFEPPPTDEDRGASPSPSPATAVSEEPGEVGEGAPIQIVEHIEEARTEKPTVSLLDRLVPAVGAGFRLPTTDFFDPPGDNLPKEDPEALYERANLLTRVLATYGVHGTVADIHTGPTVSTFELIPQEGTRVNKVAGLSDDLALGLACPVRIIAPIPNKNRIGFEIPNKDRIPVNLRELVEDRRFVESSYPLPVVLGRDIVGKPFFADLAAMPHVIVAGATGAGKSVGLNVMLTSLLTRRTPEELRMLMIDPKVVELAPFDKIPHLLLPVVTDMKQAANALKWTVDEMERRYQLFAEAGTKNIASYNGWCDRCARGEVRGYKQTKPSTKVLEDGSVLEVGPEFEAKPLPEKLPYIVIVVDEFADLMMQQGKDVEQAIARLAQKARAAGMHVILATQRPSVDVITGMIKANFPTRIAFKVTQKVDSRTILDEMGADQLLGRGDMLVKMNGTNETRRVQCPFVSEEEVQKITDFLRLQGEPVYDERILAPRDEDGSPAGDEDGEQDAKYDDAVRVVAETRRCSTSWIQRKLGLGYNRAAKIVETMEKRGIVGPANGAKDREVLIAPM